MKTRLLLAATIAAALCFYSFDRSTAVAQDLGIGSKAPDLDIEHWLQDGNGFFKPVEKFEDGKVYVVEFWATWCGPCIQSMPHLAELQNKYRGSNVQIVSVSDESVDEVKDLLVKENEALGKTFADITSAYSLTTDPDGSVQKDYMLAAKQEGIPTSFIVGKSGLIEWIGHPMELDQPLEAVVNDSWDREAFKKEMRLQQELQATMQKIGMLAGAGKFEEAIKVADAARAAAEGTPMSDQWTEIRYRLKLSSGQLDDDTLAYFRGLLEKMKGDPSGVGRFAFMIYGETQRGGEVGPLAADAIAATNAEVDAAPEELKPLLYNTIALLNVHTGEIAAAIDAQQSAVDSASDERMKGRLRNMLDELKRKAEGDDASDDTPESK